MTEEESEFNKTFNGLFDAIKDKEIAQWYIDLIKLYADTHARQMSVEFYMIMTDEVDKEVEQWAKENYDTFTQSKDKVKCPVCNGFGYTAEHANTPHENGECDGECPYQVQCNACEATGFAQSKGKDDAE